MKLKEENLRSYSYKGPSWEKQGWKSRKSMDNSPCQAPYSHMGHFGTQKASILTEDAFLEEGSPETHRDDQLRNWSCRFNRAQADLSWRTADACLDG